jgi:hypothetical protein
MKGESYNLQELRREEKKIKKERKKERKGAEVKKRRRVMENNSLIETVACFWKEGSKQTQHGCVALGSILKFSKLLHI